MTETNLHGDGNTDALASALNAASDRLETIAARNIELKNRFEDEGWSGLDKADIAESAINTTREKLAQLADDIGVGGQAIREAHAKNTMVGNRSTVAST